MERAKRNPFRGLHRRSGQGAIPEHGRFPGHQHAGLRQGWEPWARVSAPSLSGFAKEFYGSYLHRELSCEVYETIFQPPKPFCATVFNFVPLQKRFASGELLSLPAFDGIVTGSDGAKPAIYRDMYLGLAQYPTGLLGKLFYDTGLFSPRGMETFIGHFRHVAGTIAAEPDVRLGDVLC